MLKQDMDDVPVEVATLRAGALFGEFALLADRRRHATVQAVEPCELLMIPQRLLRELAATYEEVGPAIERLYRRRLLGTLVVTAPFFRALAQEERAVLMPMFTLRRVPAGEVIVREGEKGGGLYLVLLGTVDVTKRVGEDRAVLLASLGEGAYFGEMSLLSGGVASATVRAVGMVELAQLPAQVFYDVLSRNPAVWNELRGEARRRDLANQGLLSGDTSMA